MAGVEGQFAGEEAERALAILRALEGEPINFILDVCANVMSDAIAIIAAAQMADPAKRLVGAERVADEIAENIKLLLRQRHPHVFGIPAGIATGRAQ
jgi:hypothetical protein